MIHFIWGYQKHFRVDREIDAKNVLQLLDERFLPQVFLVGILYEPRPGLHPACVEPEDDFWIDSDAFDSVLEIASDKGSRTQYVISNLLAQRRLEDAEFRASVRDAILEVINKHPERPGLEFFASVPERVVPFLVSVVIGIQKDVLTSRYRLERGELLLWEYKDTLVARSLVDAAVYEFFEYAANELKKPEPGSPGGSRRDAEEFVRYAGRRLVNDVAVRVDEHAIEG